MAQQAPGNQSLAVILRVVTGIHMMHAVGFVNTRTGLLSSLRTCLYTAAPRNEAQDCRLRVLPAPNHSFHDTTRRP